LKQSSKGLGGDAGVKTCGETSPITGPRVADPAAERPTSTRLGDNRRVHACRFRHRHVSATTEGFTRAVSDIDTSRRQPKVSLRAVVDSFHNNGPRGVGRSQHPGLDRLWSLLLVTPADSSGDAGRQARSGRARRSDSGVCITSIFVPMSAGTEAVVDRDTAMAVASATGTVHSAG
jgi:hypothetical protein